VTFEERGAAFPVLEHAYLNIGSVGPVARRTYETLVAVGGGWRPGKLAVHRADDRRAAGCGRRWRRRSAWIQAVAQPRRRRRVRIVMAAGLGPLTSRDDGREALQTDRCVSRHPA
jgi:hypothetical protein